MGLEKDKIKEENIMSADFDDKSKEPSMDNIFWDDFGWDLDFWDDIDQIESKIDKDLYYYLKLIWNIIWNINIIVFILLTLLSWYFYVQNSNSFHREPMLDSVCEYILPAEVIEEWEFCSWVSSLLAKRTEEVDSLTQEQFEKVFNWLPKIYSLENFIFTKEVQFLLKQSENKMQVLSILTDFDNLLKDFYSIDKWQIKCEWIEISSDLILSTQCSVFSADWNDEIMWYDGSYINKTGWSTISLASSFLNYIQKESKDFSLVSKQKKFTKDKFTWNWYYTYSTTFTLQLKYMNSWSYNF